LLVSYFDFILWLFVLPIELPRLSLTTFLPLTHRHRTQLFMLEKMGMTITARRVNSFVGGESFWMVSFLSCEFSDCFFMTDLTQLLFVSYERITQPSPGVNKEECGRNGPCFRPQVAG